MKRRPAPTIMLMAMLTLPVLALSGCGQKGPLYLPEKTGEVVTRPTQTPPEPSTSASSPQTVDTPPATGTPDASKVDPASTEAAKKDDAKKSTQDAGTPQH